MTVSRMAAPLAQCVPRLIGLSHDGSWPTHTPLTTSAVTVQPTEQCVQMFLTMVALAPPGGRPPAAFAFFTAPKLIDPTAARPPTVRPDRFRKARRSMALEARPAATACNLLRLTSPLFRLISIGQPSLLQGLVA